MQLEARVITIEATSSPQKWNFNHLRGSRWKLKVMKRYSQRASETMGAKVKIPLNNRCIEGVTQRQVKPSSQTKTSPPSIGILSIPPSRLFN